MNARHTIITFHLLRKFTESIEHERLSPIHSSYEGLLSYNDVLEIIHRMYQGQEREIYPHLDSLTKKDLLEQVIKDEYYILSWLTHTLFGERRLGN